ncbi:MAG: hypothetical protein IT365_22705 [Candidatus Hydrogenedentes bacterium]|nr:hypothetical protein [Candidatus Hydrogenedentota bacterium]
MGTFVFCLTLAFAQSASETTSPSTPLSQPVLKADTTLDEVKAFVLRRVPALELPVSAKDWQRKQGKLRKRMLSEIVYRGVPEEWYAGDVRVEWADTLDTGNGYRIRKLRYEALPGLWIPALLYEPAEIGPRVPAILNVNGHVGPPGKSIEYEQIRCINLAKRGVLALHPEWLKFGELESDEWRHNDSAYLDLCGISGLSVFYLAMKRGLDVLADHPSADPERLGMTGLSGGGWQTILLSALDTRISLCAPNAGYIGMGVRVHNPNDIGDLEQIPPAMLKVADYTHLTAMLAPRPALLIYNEKDDCCFESARSWPSVFDPIVPFYRLYNAEGAFQSHNNQDPGTHNYDLDNRLAFYRFVSSQWGLGWTDEELPVEGEIRTKEELTVGIPRSNETFITLAKNAMASLPLQTTDSVEMRRQLLADLTGWRAVKAIAGESISVAHPSITVHSTFLKTEDWSIPLLILENAAVNSKGTWLMLADEGKPSLEVDATARIAEGWRVLLMDPLFVGECTVAPNKPAQFAMLINTTGATLLGEQASQITSTLTWTREQFGATPVHLRARGRVCGLASLVAGALAPDTLDELHVEEGLSSLKDLLAQGIHYDDAPSLFCFGLLGHFDIGDLESLCPAFKEK